MTRQSLPYGYDRPSPLSVSEAEAQLRSGRFKVLTSDVFDTLVWRSVAQPADLFNHLAARARAAGLLPSYVTDAYFVRSRIEMEHAAREKALQRFAEAECNLTEIWQEAPSGWFDDPDRARARLLDLEIELESDQLRPLPTGNRLLDAAREGGVDIHLVSDFYMTAEQLSTVLAAAGVNLDRVTVHTSADARCSKFSGLLNDVLTDLDGPGGALHIGDNYVSDIVAGHVAGASVAHLDITADDDHVALVDQAWDRFSLSSGSDGGRRAMARETLVQHHDLATSASYQFGATVAGPIMAGFAAWVGHTARELGAARVHYLLREGARIADLVDIVDPHAPTAQLVHASRWAYTRASVFEGTPYELMRALARRGSLTADYVHRSFGIEPSLATSVMGAVEVPLDDRLAAYEALADDDDVREQIVARSAELRVPLTRYLERTLRPDDGPLVVCDIGWGGTIQECLGELLAREPALSELLGGQREVIGLYALLSDSGVRRAAQGQRLMAYLPAHGTHGRSIELSRVATRHSEFLERVNTPQLGTLLGFTDDGQPVTQPDDHDHISASLRVAQRGVADFCTIAAEHIFSDDELTEVWVNDTGFTETMLESFTDVIRNPSNELASELSGWEHDDVGGEGAEALADASFTRWLPHLNAVDAEKLTMADVFWLQGAGDTAIGSLMELVRLGADPDRVAPPAPTGETLIAVFEPGEQLAGAQTKRQLRPSLAGSMLAEIESTISGVRSVRFDPGDTAHLLTLHDARVEVTRQDGTEEVLVDNVAELRAAARWVAGVWIDEHQAVVRPGGHLLFDPSGCDDVARIRVRIGFSTAHLGERAIESFTPRAREVAQRIGRGVRTRAARVKDRMGSNPG